MAHDKMITPQDAIEVTCVLGKKIRTTHAYWQYISEIKHGDLAGRLDDALGTLTKADEVWRDAERKGIVVYYRRVNGHWACVVARHLNGDGFVVTAYLTKKSKRKGIMIWPRKK